MKIAISTDDNRVSPHFGPCPQFTLAVMGVEGSIDAVIEKILDGTLKGGRGLCSPGQGKGYGIDQSTCKHKEE